MSRRLEDRVAVVTGAGSGIGAATAVAMAAEGATVICADIDGDRAMTVAAAIGPSASAVQLYVSELDANDSLAEQVAREYGTVHAVHLNAGVGSPRCVLDLTVEDWDRTMAVNLRGVFLGMRAFGRVMRRGSGGSIVVTSSGAGLLGSPGFGAYAASKHGVLGLVRSAAADLGQWDIRVNAVCPGVIDTPMLGAAHGSPEALTHLAAEHPLGRCGQPEEIARVVAFLSSDDASFITGGAYPVDGGVTAVIGMHRTRPT